MTEPSGTDPNALDPARAELVAGLTELASQLPDRIDIDPDAVSRDLARLVLTVVELLRRVVEHQAVRRMEDPDLTEEQIERMGLALWRLEEKMGRSPSIPPGRSSSPGSPRGRGR